MLELIGRYLIVPFLSIVISLYEGPGEGWNPETRKTVIGWLVLLFVIYVIGCGVWSCAEAFKTHPVQHASAVTQHVSTDSNKFNYKFNDTGVDDGLN